MRKIRLLATARDVGAARHMIEIVRAAREAADMDAVFCATDAAAEALTAAGETPIPLDGAPPYVPDPPPAAIAAARQSARKLLASEAPDVVLCSLSTFPGGIDDAVIEAARRDGRNTPSVLLCDDVAHPSTSHRPHPDHIFAVTDEIGRWATSMFDSAVHVIGSPRHFAYSKLGVGSIRANARASFGMAGQARLVVFFAQTNHLPGHFDNFQLFAKTLTELREQMPEARLLIRAHPSYRSDGLMCFEHARQNLPDTLYDESVDPVPALCAADAVFSCVSSVIADYIWLARAGESMRAYLSYLLVGDEIKSALAQRDDDWMPPLARTGMANVVAVGAELKPAIISALNADRDVSYRAHLQRKLVDPAERAVDLVRDFCGA